MKIFYFFSFWHWIQNQSFKGLYPLSIGSKITQFAEETKELRLYKEGVPNWSFNTKKFPETNMICRAGDLGKTDIDFIVFELIDAAFYGWKLE